MLEILMISFGVVYLMLGAFTAGGAVGYGIGIDELKNTSIVVLLFGILVTVIVWPVCWIAGFFSE